VNHNAQLQETLQQNSDCSFKVEDPLQVEKQAGTVTAYSHIARGPLFDFMSGVSKTHRDTLLLADQVL
jgi:hypothetical protein